MEAVKIAAKTLADAFGFVRPFVSSSSPLPALRRVAYLQDTKNGAGTLVGQDGVIGAACDSPVKFGAKSTSFDGLRIHSLMTLLGDEQVSVTSSDGQVLLAGGSSRAVFMKAAADDYPLPAWPNVRGLKPAPAGFLDALRLASFCCDQKGLAGVLAGVCLHSDSVMATDGARAIRVPLDSENRLGEVAILPPRLVTTLCAMDGFVPDHWGVIDGRLWLRQESRYVWSSLLEPPFPDIASVFDRAHGLAKAAPAVLYDSAEVGRVFEAIVAVGGAVASGTLANGQLAVDSAADVSSIKTNVPVKKSRGGGKFVADVKKFQEATGRFGSVVLCGQGVLYFFSKESGAEHVLMEIVE